MTSHLEDEFCCFNHCRGACEQTINVNGVFVEYWTTESAYIVSNEIGFLCKNLIISFAIILQGSRKI